MSSRARKLDSLSPGEAIALQKGLARRIVRADRLGAVLRTRAGVKPVYVSIGHRVSLATAVRYVMACTTRYRLPEPLRRAHRLASAEA